MASNPTPDNPQIALALADQMADGCHNHEVSIGIKQNTEAVMRATITATLNAMMVFGAAKTLTGSKANAVKLASEAAATTLSNCRLRLVNKLGNRWNNDWQATGFPDNSTAVPADQDARLTLLSKLAIYFTNNPTMASADMEATAAICTAEHTAFSDARQDLADAKTDQETKFNLREAAVVELRKRIRSLISELETLISVEDPRWEAFGLNIPANPSAPLGIATLTVTAQGGGKAHLEWSYATRMTGTRLMTKRTTGTVIDPDFINAGTVEGLEKTLSGFEPGSIVQFQVIPYNDGGDGPGSPVEEVTIT